MQQPAATPTIPCRRVIDARHAVTRCERCGPRAHNMCSVIAFKDLVRLAAIAVSVDVEPGRGFIAEGDPAAHFFNITAGTAKLFKLLPDGRRQVTGFAGIGDFLGLAVSSAYAFNAEAVDPMRMCRYSRGKLTALLADFPAMEQRLLAMASNELVAAQEQMLLLGRKSARERLASFLIGRMVASEHGPGHAGAMADRVMLPMSRNDIADYLGLRVETVSRGMTWLKGEGMISMAVGSHITLRNPAALRALANGLNLVASAH